MKRLVFSAMLMLGSAFATQYPLTIKDDLGNTVVIKKEPMRIISMLPSNTETLCALGACDRLIGRDDYSNFPKSVEKVQAFGGLYNPNVEGMIAAKPDLVIASKYGKLSERLQQAGIPVIAVNPETYQDIFRKTTLLGKVLNKESQAKALNIKVQAEVKKYEILAKTVKNPRVYFEIDPAPYSIGPNSFMGVILSKAGAQNIIPAELGDFPKISPELVIEKNPQVMLGLSLADAQKRPGWSSIDAVKNKKVIEIPWELNEMLGRPGPRIGEALKGLVKLLHPELAKK